VVFSFTTFQNENLTVRQEIVLGNTQITEISLLKN